MSTPPTRSPGPANIASSPPLLHEDTTPRISSPLNPSPKPLAPPLPRSPYQQPLAHTHTSLTEFPRMSTTSGPSPASQSQDYSPYGSSEGNTTEVWTSSRQRVDSEPTTRQSRHSSPGSYTAARYRTDSFPRPRSMGGQEPTYAHAQGHGHGSGIGIGSSRSQSTQDILFPSSSYSSSSSLPASSPLTVDGQPFSASPLSSSLLTRHSGSSQGGSRGHSPASAQSSSPQFYSQHNFHSQSQSLPRSRSSARTQSRLSHLHPHSTSPSPIPPPPSQSPSSSSFHLPHTQSLIQRSFVDARTLMSSPTRNVMHRDHARESRLAEDEWGDGLGDDRFESSGFGSEARAFKNDSIWSSFSRDGSQEVHRPGHPRSHPSVFHDGLGSVPLSGYASPFQQDPLFSEDLGDGFGSVPLPIGYNRTHRDSFGDGYGFGWEGYEEEAESQMRGRSLGTGQGRSRRSEAWSESRMQAQNLRRGGDSFVQQQDDSQHWPYEHSQPALTTRRGDADLEAQQGGHDRMGGVSRSASVRGDSVEPLDSRPSTLSATPMHPSPGQSSPSAYSHSQSSSISPSPSPLFSHPHTSPSFTSVALELEGADTDEKHAKGSWFGKRVGSMAGRHHAKDEDHGDKERRGTKDQDNHVDENKDNNHHNQRSVVQGVVKDTEKQEEEQSRSPSKSIFSSGTPTAESIGDGRERSREADPGTSEVIKESEHGRDVKRVGWGVKAGKEEDHDDPVRDSESEHTDVHAERERETWISLFAFWDEEFTRRTRTAGGKLSPAGEALLKAGRTVSLIGHALSPIIQEGLITTVDALAFVPLPGLEVAARALLGVWEACHAVETNRHSCLRLAERCATLLYAIRSEIADAGEDVAKDLAAPLERLCDALNQIHAFLQTQIHRSFLKRYLKREEIAKDLRACHQVVTDVVGMFGMSIQMRTLKQVHAAADESRRFAEEAQHQLEMEHQLHQFQPGEQGRHCRLGNALGLTVDHVSVGLDEDRGYATPPPAYRSPQAPMGQLTPIESGNGSRSMTSFTSIPSIAQSMALAPPPARTAFSSDAMVLESQAARLQDPQSMETDGTVPPIHALTHLHNTQNASDAAADVAALRRTLSEALNAGNDVELLRRLQEGVGEHGGRSGKRAIWDTLWASSTTDEDEYGNGGETDGYVHEMGRIDMLDREFMETGRAGGVGEEGAAPWNPANWTITRYEVDRTRKIGIGFFSDVYLGRWRGRDVALKHLEIPESIQTSCLYMAPSSAMGDRPWFFGSGEGSDVGTNEEQIDLLRCMHQIAKGMEYLHGRGVLHGDLKAANVLVDDTGRCLISDFGHSEMKAEAYRLNEQPFPRGTLRWQAPELLLGDNRLTNAVDIYAFAICCVEILGMGDLPWAKLDDATVASLVLDKDQRPPLPKLGRHANVANMVEALIHSCWARNPDSRPSFAHIAASLSELRSRQGQGGDESPLPLSLDDFSDATHIRRNRVRSPDMHPMSDSLASIDSGSSSLALDVRSSSESSADEYYETADDTTPIDVEDETFAVPGSWDESPQVLPHCLPTGMRVWVKYQAQNSSSLARSSPHGSANALREIEYIDSPPPAQERQVAARNERRYRMLMQRTHAFHKSLTLPLWSPTRVELGAVGYLSKPNGEFITLFNALDPSKGSEDSLRGLPSMYKYGDFTKYGREDNVRDVAQRSLDALSGSLTFKTRGDQSYSEKIVRRYSFPLNEGQKSACICVERTVYRFIDNLDAPKKWFRHHVDAILEVYAPHHPIQKEDLFLVMGVLDAPDYALFVSHSHSEGQAHFNVFADNGVGRPWGTFTTERGAPAGSTGLPHLEEISEQTIFASKVSTTRGSDENVLGKWDTLMLARLRFMPDVEEPTLL
ncbi:hypothetical protein BU15DRAFT_80438 [Melanogaster broomeanus]|nr:hypothetical protein BU15DRAFT_80438 [Melanogaster broomeanus]